MDYLPEAVIYSKECPLYYAMLYDAVTKAIDALQHQNYGTALETLSLIQESSLAVYRKSKEDGK
ncbi:MAG: hypothetical protein Q3985_02590 [Eubacteriales bacterium]|nr:hypothetical protein [Eubacteriales bacterium]